MMILVGLRAGETVIDMQEVSALLGLPALAAELPRA